jgi:oligopeptide transport system substrate-binding protein
MRQGKKHTWMTLMNLMALGSLFVVLLAGCSGSNAASRSTKPSPAPPSQQVLTVADVTDFTDETGPNVAIMDPGVISDATTQDMAEKVFPTLLVLQYDPHSSSGLTLAPWAATGLPTFSGDGLLMTVHIRPGMFWTDGTPIDANDFAYSINRALDPCTGTQSDLGRGLGSSFLSWIAGAARFSNKACPKSQQNALDPHSGQGLLGTSIIAEDAQTLQIRLAVPATWAEWSLVTTPAMAVPRSLITKYGLSHWTDHLTDGAGFGGNVFNLSSRDHSGHMTFVANPTFWGSPKPILQKIVFTFYADPSTAYRAYLEGQAMQAYALPPEDYTSAAQRPDFHEVPILDIDYTAPNWGKAPFNNLLARQAFDLALDKAQLIQTVLPGTAFATNHMIPLGEGDYDPHLVGPDGTPSLTGNQSLAQSDWQQYAAANCPGGQPANCPAVTFLISEYPLIERMALAEVSQWQQVLGVHVKLEVLPGPQWDSLIFTSPLAQLPQLFNIGYTVDFPVGWDWTTLQALPDAGGDPNYINDPAANQLMITADGDQNGTQQAREYQAAEQQLVQDVAWIPLSQDINFWFNTAKVYGFTLSPAVYWLPGNMLQTYIAA